MTPVRIAKKKTSNCWKCQIMEGKKLWKEHSFICGGTVKKPKKFG